MDKSNSRERPGTLQSKKLTELREKKRIGRNSKSNAWASWTDWSQEVARHKVRVQNRLTS
jgi:hypothetical protein